MEKRKMISLVLCILFLFLIFFYFVKGAIKEKEVEEIKLKNFNNPDNPKFWIEYQGTEIFNITHSGKMTVVGNITANNTYIGFEEGDHYICFYEDGNPCGEYIKWNDYLDEFQILDRLLIDDILFVSSTIFAGDTANALIAGGDISTSGDGDDLWLGTVTQSNAKFRAYAMGNLSAKNISAESYRNESGYLEWIKPENIFDVDKEDIETDLNTFVDIAGDTMVGNLVMSNANITLLPNSILRAIGFIDLNYSIFNIEETAETDTKNSLVTIAALGSFWYGSSYGINITSEDVDVIPLGLDVPSEGTYINFTLSGTGIGSIANNGYFLTLKTLSEFWIDTLTYFRIYVGNWQFLTMSKSPAFILFNPDYNAIDFVVRGGTSNLIYASASSQKVGINAPAKISEVLTVNGNFSCTDAKIKGNFTGNQIYGEAFYHNHTATPINFEVDGKFYNLTMSNFTLNGFSTGNENQTLICKIPGKYLANYMASGDGQNNHEYYTTIGINGIAQSSVESHKKMSAGGDIVTMTGNGFIRLQLNDVVTLMTADIGNTGIGNYYSSNLNLVRIGD